MAENTLISPFLGSFMTAIFIFSTIYTLAFYYNQGAGSSLGVDALEDSPNDPTSVSTESSGIFGFVIRGLDAVLEFLSWISPFALLKALLIVVMDPVPLLYQILNLLVLRPVGWISTIFTVNYILSRIPTEHGEI